PTNANSYFYPSAQLAVIFTDAISWRPRWLDYGKVRVSKAKVGNDAPQYALTTRYNNAGATGANNDQQQFGGPSLSFPFRGVTSIYLSGYSWSQIRIMEGEPYGVIWGYGWKKNCVAAAPCFNDVAAGTLLIGDDGYPIKSDDQRNLGSVQPDWTGSAMSEF